jgi:hypothetical protein
MKLGVCLRRAQNAFPQLLTHGLVISQDFEIADLLEAMAGVYDPLTTFGKDWAQIRAGSLH